MPERIVIACDAVDTQSQLLRRVREVLA
jgi:hypothetical protein